MHAPCARSPHPGCPRSHELRSFPNWLHNHPEQPPIHVEKHPPPRRNAGPPNRPYPANDTSRGALGIALKYTGNERWLPLTGPGQSGDRFPGYRHEERFESSSASLPKVCNILVDFARVSLCQLNAKHRQKLNRATPNVACRTVAYSGPKTNYSPK